MSDTTPTNKTSRCSEAFFAEVDFPSVIRPRLVIEYTNGLRLLIENERDLELAAKFIRLKRQLDREGATQ